MQWSNIALIVAAAFQLTASLWYLKTVYRHATVMNPASWGLWMMLSMLNVTAYLMIAESWWLAIIPMLSCLSTICVFSLALYVHAAAPIDWLDETAVVVGIIAVGAWIGSGSAAYATIIIQLAFCVGFIPTFRSMILGRTHEPLGPWVFWTLAYFANLFAVGFAGSLSPAEYAYPLTSIVLHAIGVSLIAAAVAAKTIKHHPVPALKIIGL